jgi:hypothetical protein
MNSFMQMARVAPEKTIHHRPAYLPLFLVNTFGES